MSGNTLDAFDNHGKTKLYCAVNDKNLELVRQLILAGANANKATSYGKFPLDAALDRGDSDAIECLLQNGANISVVEKTALHSAIGRNRSIVEILLMYGSDVNALNSQRQSPLHIACETFDPFALTTLLDHGADVNLRDAKLKTPLHVAIEWRMFNHIRPLLRRGTNPNLRDEDSKTPLHLLCEKSKNGEKVKTETLKCFLESPSLVPVDVNATSPGGTALLIASYRQDADRVELLVAHGADVNAVGHCFPNDAQRREAPLSLVFNRFPQRNMDDWEDPNEQDDHFFDIDWDVPALFSILKCLLRHGANIDYRGIDSSVELPIVGAMKCQREAFALQLLKHGSPVDITIFGLPLIIRAWEKKMYQLVIALLKMQWNETRLIRYCLKKVHHQLRLDNQFAPPYSPLVGRQEEIKRLCTLRIAEPLSLSMLAVSAVRRGLSKATSASILGRIDKLQVPNHLKEILKLEDVIPDQDFLK